MPQLQPANIEQLLRKDTMQDDWREFLRQLNYTFKDIYSWLDQAFGILQRDTGETESAIEVSDGTITQAKLSTTYGEISGTGQGSLPGGEYGLCPRFRIKNAGGDWYTAYRAFEHDNDPNYHTTCYLAKNVDGTPWGYQRYITASGEVFWLYLLRRLDTGEITHTWSSHDHPCMGDGGNPEQIPHPFLGYNPKTGIKTIRHINGTVEQYEAEIIVANPSQSEVKKCHFMSQISGRLSRLQKNPVYRGRGEIMMEDYKFERPAKWPDKPVTVALPDDWDRAWLEQREVEPLKRKIPMPDYVKCLKMEKKPDEKEK